MKKMTFKLFGTKIQITFLFMAFLTLLIATDKSGLIIPFVIATLLHEAAHLLGMWIVDSNPRSVRLIPACVEITRGVGTKYSHEIFVSLCGPLINLILFFVFYTDYCFTHSGWVIDFAIINLILGLFNLLPAVGLDGGDILKNLVSKRFSDGTAIIALRTSTLIISAILLIIGVFLLKNSNGNFSLIIMALYLIISVLIKL